MMAPYYMGGDKHERKGSATGGSLMEQASQAERVENYLTGDRNERSNMRVEYNYLCEMWASKTLSA